jgi:hypothetical protein
MSDTPNTNALLDQFDAAMKLIEITRRERDEARELADSYRIAFCSANGFDRTPEPFPWELAK